MTTFEIRVAVVATAIALMAGCVSPPSANRHPRTVALILSGDVVSYAAPGSATRVSVASVDGKPVKEPYGPVELTPGRHTVALGCDGVPVTHVFTVAAGEVYQFVVRSNPGIKGCVGALSRVRSTNP